MPNPVFIGRKAELERLKALYKKKASSLVVVKGRRRIGKSRLIGEFAHTSRAQTFWSFAGLAPEDGISDQQQRDNFARQLALMLKIPPMTADNLPPSMSILPINPHESIWAPYSILSHKPGPIKLMLCLHL